MRKVWLLGTVVFTGGLLAGFLPSRATAQDVYTGTVANSRFPASPATLRITVTSDNANRLIGYLQIGPPLGGSGPFSGTRSGDSLYLVTRSATGDTIVWMSAFNHGDIGGGYWITGGPFKGQSGVWSAQFVTASVAVAPRQNQTVNPPQLDQLAVEIVDQSEGLVGERLVYFVRESIRRSSAFRLTETREPRIQVILSTMPRLEDAPNSSAMYSVVWNLVIGDETSGWTFLYLDNTLGYAGTQVVNSSAETIVARTDQLITNVRRMLNSQ